MYIFFLLSLVIYAYLYLFLLSFDLLSFSDAGTPSPLFFFFCLFVWWDAEKWGERSLHFFPSSPFLSLITIKWSKFFFFFFLEGWGGKKWSTKYSSFGLQFSLSPLHFWSHLKFWTVPRLDIRHHMTIDHPSNNEPLLFIWF